MEFRKEWIDTIEFRGKEVRLEMAAVLIPNALNKAEFNSKFPNAGENDLAFTLHVTAKGAGLVGLFSDDVVADPNDWKVSQRDIEKAKRNWTASAIATIAELINE